jgi:putative hydrolase of the HAD superfamily
MGMIGWIGLDADDTLWENEAYYTRAKREFQVILAPFASEEECTQVLERREIENVTIYGYGIKGFTLSMLEAGLELSEGRIGAQEVGALLSVGRRLLAQPVELRPHAGETIQVLAQRFSLILITKGDIFEQGRKISLSGLQEKFTHIEIVGEKTRQTYVTLLNRYGVTPREFVMVGNSLRSDILPVLEIGARAVHIPNENTWSHEDLAESDLEGYQYDVLPDLKALPAFLASLAL